VELVDGLVDVRSGAAGCSRERGDEERAVLAEAELPDHVDLPKDDHLVTKYGVQPIDLAGDEPDHG